MAEMVLHAVTHLEMLMATTSPHALDGAHADVTDYMYVLSRTPRNEEVSHGELSARGGGDGQKEYLGGHAILGDLFPWPISQRQIGGVARGTSITATIQIFSGGARKLALSVPCASSSLTNRVERLLAPLPPPPSQSV